MDAGFTTCGNFPESNPGIEYNSTMSPSIAAGDTDFLDTLTTSLSVVVLQFLLICATTKTRLGESCQKCLLSLLTLGAGGHPRRERFLDRHLVSGNTW